METTCWFCSADLDDDGVAATVAGEVSCDACARWSATRTLEDFLASRWLARRRAIVGRDRVARHRRATAAA